MRQIIAIGASAGGLEALLRIVHTLEPGMSAAVLVVIHSSSDFPSFLPEILSRGGPLSATHAQDGEAIQPGRIYVARPGYHLGVTREQVRVWFGAKINRFRPAIDPLLRSVAENYGVRAIGVLLSGAMTDGVAGLLALKRAGGVAIVQDPADALVPTLPRNALSVVAVDHVISASQMGNLFGQLTRRAVETGAKAMPDSLIQAQNAMSQDFAAQARGERVGQLSLFSCPNCGGVMRQTQEVRMAEFLCHVGHSFDGETLLEAQAESIETTIWSLIRSLKERALLARELAALAGDRGDADANGRLERIAVEAERQAAVMEGNLSKGPQEEK